MNRQTDSNPSLAFDAVAVYRAFFDGSVHNFFEATENAVDDGRAHVYLVEGLSPWQERKVRELIPGLPDEFFEWHLQDSLACINSDFQNDRVVLAKWSRAVSQRKEVWQREHKLRTLGSPYNLDDKNPVSSRFDHERYSHISEPYRSYDPTYAYSEKIAAEPKVILRDMIMHAARESISLYHSIDNDKLACVVLFDPSRKYRVTKVTYDTEQSTNEESADFEAFRKDRNSLGRCSTHIRKTRTAPQQNDVIRAVTDAVVQILMEDHAKLLSCLNKAIDDIELSLREGLNSPGSWRVYPSRWRNHLFHQLDAVAYFIALLTQNAVSYPASSTSCSWTRQVKALKTAERKLEAMMRRLEGTYQVLMSSITILESEKAIEQAEVVTRVTNLAFFFIPLSFVSSVFGMNVNVSAGLVVIEG
ncbi:hypothetical protein N656DRAFT_794352 [Canariomyces notabilis]|uniref:Uncharacterized protein n=1 Tax=Canariomyces notabilis TaxID=2074819 RepID=A0AAN6YWE3_9PEZI|nr:hypothetical protein N656DRAFT_794352 [Canariomyces arenarius]